MPDPPPKRNGQTAAYCTYCGKEITDVAYVVEARDVTRLLNVPHQCISAMFQVPPE